MIHHRQRLPLDGKAGDDLIGIHAATNDFECDIAHQRLSLLREKDRPESTFADRAHEAIAVNHISNLLRSPPVILPARSAPTLIEISSGAIEETGLGVMH